MRPEELADLGLAPRTQTVNPNRRKCPVCKSTCSVASIIPIYVRESTESPTSSNETAKPEEDDDDENNNAGAVIPDTETPSNDLEYLETTSTGLRRRNTGVSQEAQTSSNNTVPSRPSVTPVPLSGAEASSSVANIPIPSNGYGASGWADPLAPTTTRIHHGAFTNSLLVSLQQATSNSNESSDHVPPIHRRPGDHAHSHSRSYVNETPRPTEYASRVLIMLTSFLVLYLLLT